MVINREKIYLQIRPNCIEVSNIVPSCFANYCENHLSCQRCVEKYKCKLIPRPKEPQWCNPD